VVSSRELNAIHGRIRGWYATYGRKDLPWRQTRDPYAIYVSEIMLQQTQVQTVLARFYHPFLVRFPTLKALAEAPEEEVMRAWQGLGYYRRAKHLHRAAQVAGRQCLKQLMRSSHCQVLAGIPPMRLLLLPTINPCR